MSIVTLQWITGAVALFLGRELRFLFAGLMAVFIGIRTTSLLPSGLPPWGGFAFIFVIAVIAIGLSLISKDVSFYVCGFLAGGFAINELLAPGLSSIPWVFFILGSILLSFIVGLTKDWGLIVVTCLIGTYVVIGLLPLVGTARTLASGGIFVVGTLAQVVMFQLQSNNEE